MSDTVYAIASGKGGVGKTTTAINLGAMLADRDHSVVVVDTDLGMANLADFLDFEIETPTLHEVLAGDADPEEATYRAPGGIDVLPSATDIEAFVKSDPANLQAVVAALREEYDYVLLDTGAGVSYDTLVPLALADGVLLVATPDVASVRDTAKTGELAERVESEVRGAVLTQRSSDILNADDVEETLGTDVLAVIPQDEAVPMGIDAGRPLAAFAPNAPAGRAYRDLAAVLTGDADPDPELETVAETEAGAETEPAVASVGSESAQIGSGRGESVGDESAKAGSDDASAASPDADKSDFETPEVEPADSDSAESESARSESTSFESVGTESADPESPGSGSGGSEPTDAENADDPLSADAARNVRDAIGGDSDGDIDSLFEGQQADAPESAEAALGDDGNDGNDESADGDDTPRASSEFGGSGARSVDDLINEHISDERLSGDSGGDGDPLAEMSDEFGGSADGGDDGSDPLTTEDPFADEPDGDENSPTDADAGTDGASERVEDEESGGADEAGTVPFGNDERSSRSDGPERRATDAAADGVSTDGVSTDGVSADGVPAGEAESDGFDPDEPAGDGESVEDSLGPDRSDDDESSEDGGVLGRLGSLFR